MTVSSHSWGIGARTFGKVFVTALVWLVGVVPLKGLQAVSTDRFAAVKRYWEWSSYWGIDGLDFAQAVYRTGRSFRALVFFSEDTHPGDPYWGFCSRDLQTCQVYFAWPDNTIFEARSIRMRKTETEENALRRLQRPCPGKRRMHGDCALR